MLAGYETTALTLSYGFWLLAQNSQLKDQNEIKEVYGDAPLDSKKLKELPITIATIKEIMRLYPSAYMINRSNEETLQYKDLKFNPHTTFFFPQFAVHRHKDFWEKTATVQSGTLHWGKDPDAYFPFGGGPRTCVGNHLALVEATVCFGEIIRRFDCHWPRQTIKLLPSVTMVPNPDLKIIFKEGQKLGFSGIKTSPQFALEDLDDYKSYIVRDTVDFFADTLSFVPLF